MSAPDVSAPDVSAGDEQAPDADERARLDAAIDEGCRYAGLSESQRGFVVMYLHRDPLEWLSCCGSYCDPCVQTIGRAVERTRAVLGLPPWR